MKRPNWRAILLTLAIISPFVALRVIALFRDGDSWIQLLY